MAQLLKGYKIPLAVIRNCPKLLIGKRFFHYGDMRQQWKIDDVSDTKIIGRGKNEDKFSRDGGSFNDDINSIVNSIINNENTWRLTSPVEMPVMNVNEDGSIG